MTNKQAFEQQFISLCVLQGKVLHIGTRRAFGLASAWAYKCQNRLMEGRNVFTGEERRVKAEPKPAQVRCDRFASCCGNPPKVTEWRPGCYGAQCMQCGRIVGSGRPLDEDELRGEWNRTMEAQKQGG